jgi:hypothetical protein
MLARTLATPLALLAFSIGPSPQEAPPPAFPLNPAMEIWGEPGMQIFFAVLEGLYRDGVSNEVVDAVVRIDEQTNYPANFVWACPLCMPAYNAFLVYRGRREFTGMKLRRDTFGPGLAPERAERLLAVDSAVAQVALEDLILDWMDRRMDALRLTEEERAAWRSEMEIRRKQGMTYLDGYQRAGLGGSYASMKTCPICEGANGASRAR